MVASTLISEIEKSGLDIQAINGNLHVRPRKRITDSIRQAIRDQKQSLLAFMKDREGRRADITEHACISLPDTPEATTPREYKLYHLPDNWPLYWCWYAVLEPEYIKSFSLLCLLPANEVYISGHKTKEAALQYGDKTWKL